MNEKETPKNQNKVVILSVLLMALIVILGIALTIYVRVRIDLAKMDAAVKTDFKHHYVMITEDDSQLWNSVYDGACIEGSATNTYVERVGQSLDEKYSVYDLLDRAIYENVDGILIEPDGSEEVDLKISEAVSQGIPVVTLMQDSNSTMRNSYVGISYYSLGQQYADQIAKAINLRNAESNNGYDTSVTKNYKIMIIMDEDIIGSSRNIVYSAISESLKQREDIKGNIDVGAKVIKSSSLFEAEEAIRNIFMNTDNLPDVMVALDETTGACIYQALVDYNLVGDVEVIASFEDDTVLSGIEKNVIFSTVAVDAQSMGELAVRALNEYLDTGFSSDYYSVDSFIINRNNIDEYRGGADEE